jgi:hypothetical protein
LIEARSGLREERRSDSTLDARSAKTAEESGVKEKQVQDTMEAGNILIKDGALFPEELQIESELYVPGWRLVKDCDGQGFGSSGSGGRMDVLLLGR